MTQYRGKTLKPRLRLGPRRKAIRSILEINASLAEVLQRRDELFERLEEAQGVPLVLRLQYEDEEGNKHSEFQTVIVDKPKGHYVFYKAVDLTMNVRTSKEDRAILGLKTRTVVPKEVQEVERSGRVGRQSAKRSTPS